jgi:hypothetical protein
MTLLLVTVAAAWFMAGVGWIVQLVLYPLFALVGDGEWMRYHTEHSRRITYVVLPAMSVELGGALLVAAHRPDGVGTLVAVVGAACALSTWVITGLGAVPAHTALGAGLTPGAHRRLLRVDRLRTVGWTAHGVLAAVMVAQSAG